MGSALCVRAHLLVLALSVLFFVLYIVSAEDPGSLPYFLFVPVEPSFFLLVAE